MSIHFHRELDNISKKMIALGTEVEERVLSLETLINTNDISLAEKIICSDTEIDKMEVELEEDCLKVMALYQPVAVDLRFLIGVLKVNNELERIADEVVDSAKCILKSLTITGHLGRNIFDYGTMIELASSMLNMGLDSIVNGDTNIAGDICEMSSTVTKMRQQAYVKFKNAMLSSEINSENIDYYLRCIFLARHIERIGDHATNIAEETFYMVNGEIVRHASRKYESICGKNNTDS